MRNTSPQDSFYSLRVRQIPPTATFYAIIACSIGALIVTHILEIDGDEAMPVFMGAMILGVIVGEIVERLAGRSATS